MFVSPAWAQGAGGGGLGGMEQLLPLVLIFVVFFVQDGDAKSDKIFLRRMAPGITLFTAATLYMWFQTSQWLPPNWAHPMWLEVHNLFLIFGTFESFKKLYASNNYLAPNSEYLRKRDKDSFYIIGPGDVLSLTFTDDPIAKEEFRQELFQMIRNLTDEVIFN